MLNYIRAELYRNFNRSYFWNLTGILSLLGLALNVFFMANKNSLPDLGLNMIFTAAFGTLGMSVFFVLIIVDIVTAEEQKNSTLKNVISLGFPRSKLVLSKIITTVILSLISVTIILTIFFGSGIILLGLDGVTSEIVLNYLKRLLTTMTLCIGAISIGTFLAFAIKNNTAYSLVYVSIFLMTSTVIRVLSYFVSDKLMYLNNFLITKQISKLMEEEVTIKTILSANGVGIIYAIVFILLTIILFKKKEIK
ncbi:bacitracin ABC transporter permease protein BcrB [Gottschalkia acidurici 9a]|uniref:Bacitracin ABC transporter permease protein BcrB n=1 Tax=Gottschalkia acidurici (strain ATCC 7906 / DSM 604 / BCRC 14475 / CIP 104303 / KCTC 5404 / NCIMB 10678 / 9a) TaxID=1128398 RepID=K0B104_GOTA9|nr:ABC transporter permease [Gottschalkia acidurici]AFS79703.1 bacitracin ABC transporter permease protein BcrB [Gottschalkia acidurici 9a]